MSTRTLQQTINWAQTFIKYVPLTVGTGNQPAIDNANNVKQLMMHPNLAWNWSRKAFSFQTIAGVQDYSESISDFDYLESSSIQPCATITNVAGDGTTATLTAANKFVKGNLVTITGLTTTGFNVRGAVLLSVSPTQFTFASSTSHSSGSDAGLAVSGERTQLDSILNSEPLEVTSTLDQPHTIAAQMDDGAGNITFRFVACPEQAYNVNLEYQAQPTMFAALSDTWGPIPDRYAYIYNRGFLAECLEPIDAGRSQMEKQRFIMALVGVTEGLSLADKAIFMAQYLNIDAQTAANMLDTQQGVSAKSNS